MSLALRPRFEVDVELPSAVVVERLAGELAAGSLHLKRTRPPGGGRETAPLDRDHLMLTVPPGEQRLWSPWLTIEVAPRGVGTHVLARFSPHPSVWTGFAFAYLTLGVVLMFSLVFAGAVAMTGGSPWPLWLTGGAALALVALWWTSQIGKRLAQGQMDRLRAELERAMAAARATPPAEASAPAVT